ncbi:MAG: hypothetical protein ACLTDM_04235 [Clostridium butyricum]
MEERINEKNLGTKVKKFGYIPPMLKYICEQIDNNQKIRRYMRYATPLPLSPRSESYDKNSIIQEQPDLKCSLMADGDEGVRCLYNCYALDQDNYTVPYIFVYPSNSNQIMTGTARCLFTVVVIISGKYEELKNYGELRSFMIAEEIAQVIDNITIESSNPLYQDLGNIKFEIPPIFNYVRLTKSSPAVQLTFNIATTYNCGRVKE